MNSKRLKALFFVAILLFSIMIVPVTANAANVVTDPVLQKIVRLKLGLANNVDVTAAHVQQITSIAYSGYAATAGGKISSLNGLQYATNLTLLDITDCSVSSLSPIASLTKLKTLVIRNNPLDLRVGSADYIIVQNLKNRGCNVTYNTPTASPYLSNIKTSIGTLSPKFSPSVYSYSIVLPETKSYTVLTPTKYDAKATMYINGVKRTSYKVSVGVSTTKVITIKVVATDKSTKTYTVTITRPSSNSYLSKISATSGSLFPRFKKTTTSYLLGIDRSVSKVTITPKTENKYAKVLIDGAAVKSKTVSVANGTSTIVTITVIAQNGAKRIYYVMVCRPK